jgi:hypothetical protein
MKLFVRPTQRFKHLRSEFAKSRKARVVDARRAPDPVEQELLEGRLGDWKDDVYAASGDGIAGPGLPATTPKGLYEEFERDLAPPDETV